jgi:hypothetical protein
MIRIDALWLCVQPLDMRVAAVTDAGCTHVVEVRLPLWNGVRSPVFKRQV